MRLCVPFCSCPGNPEGSRCHARRCHHRISVSRTRDGVEECIVKGVGKGGGGDGHPLAKAMLLDSFASIGVSGAMQSGRMDRGRGLLDELLDYRGDYRRI
jgi:hypothetical protein